MRYWNADPQRNNILSSRDCGVWRDLGRYVLTLIIKVFDALLKFNTVPPLLTCNPNDIQETTNAFYALHNSWDAV
jgi:hypothetical protein